jgi:hypothetical protein
MANSLATLADAQKLAEETSQGLQGLQSVVGKWSEAAGNLTQSAGNLTTTTNALHADWQDPAGQDFANAANKDASDMKAVAQAMNPTKVSQDYAQLGEQLNKVIQAINTAMKNPLALLLPPPGEVVAGFAALGKLMTAFGQNMLNSVQNAQGKWPQSGGSNSSNNGSNSNASSASNAAQAQGQGGGDQQAQQGGAAQDGGAQAGQDQQGQGAGADPGAVPGGMDPGGDPSLQGDTPMPVLPPPTTIPPVTPLTPPPSTSMPFMPIGGLGGAGGGGIKGGGGGIGGGGGGPKSIPSAAVPMKASTITPAGAAPTLSSTTGGTAGGTSGTTGGSMGGIPPMMPMTPGGGGTTAPKSGNGTRMGGGRGPKRSSAVPGLPASLKGKSGTVDRNAFPAPAKPTRRERAEDIPTLQLLDEEMWQVDETPDASPTQVRRLLN